MKRKTLIVTTASSFALLLLAGCSTMQMGSTSAKTVATGSAGGANSQNANKQLAHCNQSLGTIAVTEDTNSYWYEILRSQYHLGPTTPVLKMLIQQSNCFVVVDRGRAMGNMMGERALSQSGELRSNSKFGKGQMVAADFSLTPSVTFSNQNAGGLGAQLGALLGSVGAAIGGNLSAKTASTMLILDDNRSGVQLAASEGSAENWDFGAYGSLYGSLASGRSRGYANTAEGKVIVAAFMDSYNGVVNAVRNYRAQHVTGGLGTGGHLGVQGVDQAGTVRNNSVFRAQQRLNNIGFDVGRPDGLMGPRTRSALQEFQRSREIPVTGKLDAATEAELNH